VEYKYGVPPEEKDGEN